jgi:hypothetical protein
MAVGLGLLVAPLTTIAVNAAGEGRSGIASSFNNTVVDVGAMFTIAMAGLLLVPVYRTALVERLSPMLPASAVDIVAGQAAKLANIPLPDGLAPTQQSAVSAAMKLALSDSLGTVIAIGGVSGFFAAAVAALMLRGIWMAKTV